MRKAAAAAAAFAPSASTRASSSSLASSSSPSSGSSSTLRFRKDFVNINEAPCGMLIGWHERSFSTLDPSNSTKCLRSVKGQRVPKDKRLVMVEPFVEKYRNDNGGKFPTITHTMHQIGGSFYVIRDILKILEVESLASGLKNMEEIESQKSEQHVDKDMHVKEEESNTSILKCSVSLEQPIDVDGFTKVAEEIDLSESHSVKIEEKNGKTSSATANLRPSENAKEKQIDDITDHSSFNVEPLHETQTISYSSEEQSTVHGSANDSNVFQQKTSQKPRLIDQDDPKPHNIHRDPCGKVIDEEQEPEPLPKSSSSDSSLWSILKSFAGGVVNFWKKA